MTLYQLSSWLTVCAKKATDKPNDGDFLLPWNSTTLHRKQYQLNQNCEVSFKRFGPLLMCHGVDASSEVIEDNCPWSGPVVKQCSQFTKRQPSPTGEVLDAA